MNTYIRWAISAVYFKSAWETTSLLSDLPSCSFHIGVTSGDLPLLLWICTDKPIEVTKEKAFLFWKKWEALLERTLQVKSKKI